MHRKFLILFILSSYLPLVIRAQSVNNPSAETAITFDIATKKISDGKQIPFDKPFDITIDKTDKIDVQRVLAVYVYKMEYYQGVRLPIHIAQYLKKKHYPVSHLQRLTRDDADIGTYKQDFSVSFDTTGKKLTMFFPAIKPNTNFDVVIHQSLSEENLNKALLVSQAINKKDTTATKVLFDNFRNSFLLKTFNPPISTTGLNNLDDFKCKLNTAEFAVLVDSITAITSYKSLIPILLRDAKTLLNTADALKIKIKNPIVLTNIRSKSVDDVALGYNIINSGLGPEKTKVFLLQTRIKNLNASVAVIQGVLDSASAIYSRTLNPDINIVCQALTSDIQNLKDNIAFLKRINGNIIKAINKSTFEGTWLIGSDDSQDLKTKGSSLMSTDLGFTNIFVTDNSNKIIYLPRLFLGLNIFFRPVDRNAILAYLPDTVSDGLKSTKTVWQHLSLSLGLTFGKINQPDFDNLYNTFSLVAGPSYRFARAFRFSAGVAVLNRMNPNPLFTNERVTAGTFVSFSVDFDLIASIKNFTDLITK